MKKSIALFLAVVALLSCCGLSMIASASFDEEIAPYYNNTNTAKIVFSISSSGKATFTVSCTGISGVTSKITAVSCIQRKVGLIWVKVDNGLDGKQWTDTVNGTTMSKSHSLQLSKTGTYRAKVEFTVSGSGGSADEITKTATDTY
ncbi:MAG: hypothetical protein ACI4GY_06980 [Acutalibacteraceae bacterium]